MFQTSVFILFWEQCAGQLDNVSKLWRTLQFPLNTTSVINVLPHEVLAKTTCSNCAILWRLEEKQTVRVNQCGSFHRVIGFFSDVAKTHQVSHQI